MSGRVRVIYHCEDGHWWAISPELPDVIAAGDTRDDVRQLVEEGLADGDYEIVHLDANDDFELAATVTGRFLADVGRLSKPPLLLVNGWRFEGLTTTEDAAAPFVAERGEDLVFA